MDNEKMINILSLGAGVQSTYVLHRWHKELDHIIFADTGWEPKAVYDHLEKLKQEYDITVVNNGNIRDDPLAEPTVPSASPPMYMDPPGMMLRQCTGYYKIRPVYKEVRRILGLRKGQNWPKEPVVRMWMGISLDEIQRMKDSQVGCIKNYYPLIEHRIRRFDCMIHDAPRSACIGCPYHTNEEWKNLLSSEFEDACDYDDQMRLGRGSFYHLEGVPYLHKSLTPLRDADLSTPHENQLSLLDECEGMCGV